MILHLYRLGSAEWAGNRIVIWREIWGLFVGIVDISAFAWRDWGKP